MKKIFYFFILLNIISLSSKAQVFTKDTILYNGSTDKYINFVVLGDGYTQVQLGQFHNDVVNLKNEFFNKSPFSHYKNYFNIISINVVSPESGIKHPHTASDCPPLSQLPISNPTNYFGTTFDNSGIHRLIYPTNDALISSVLADNFPNYDQILILGNSPEYGGAGGAYAVGSTNEYSVEIMLHECGHSFAGLSDEYWAGDVYAMENTNMTHQEFATPSLVKWKDWLGIDSINIYQHCCGGNSSQWYKPFNNCEMEYLQRNFCDVCRQAIIEKIHELVNTIVSYEPSSNTITSMDTAMDFKLTQLMLPIPNTLKIEWQLDNNTIATNTDSVHITKSSLGNQNHTLIATVTDTTFMIKTNVSYTANIDKVVWHLNLNNTSISHELSKTAYHIFPNPSDSYIQVVSDDFIGVKNATVQLLDVTGRILNHQDIQLKNNQLSCTIPTSNISSGVYFIHVVSSKGVDKMKAIIAH